MQYIVTITCSGCKQRVAIKAADTAWPFEWPEHQSLVLAHRVECAFYGAYINPKAS